MPSATNGHSHGLNGYSSASTDPKNMESANGVSKSFLEAEGEEAKILETIDKLRALGVSKEHPLPQIIVCGAQSAGKSSVLEAITGIPFPRDNGVCTKYKTIVKLLRDSAEYVELAITPCETRPTDERDHLSRFTTKISRNDWNIKGAGFMDDAKREIFNGRTDNNWTKDILSITIAGPGQRSLQLVDLPGIIGVAEVDTDVDLVREIVEAEMEQEQSFMLAVVKATDDLQNHSILRLCKKHDPTGERTLGVITRPDDGKENAPRYIDVVMGKDPYITFKHDWHVLLNRSSDDLRKKTTTKQRDDKERAFFNMAPWSDLDPKDFGIDALRDRLREMLFALAKRGLPKLHSMMASEKDRLVKELDGLGGEGMKPDELREAFRACLKRLKKVVGEGAADGTYRSGIRDAGTGSTLHLRSRIVDKSEVYRDRMIENGHAWELEGAQALDPNADIVSIYQDPSSIRCTSPEKRTLETVVKQVVTRLNKTRGAHLPGFYKPEVIDKGVWELSEGWMKISQIHIDIVFACCEQYFENIIPRAFSKTGLSAAPEPGFGNFKTIASRLYRREIAPALAERKKQAEGELLKLEQDRLEPRQNFDRKFLEDQREHRQGSNFARTVDGAAKSKEAAEKDKEISPRDVASSQGRHTQQEQTEEKAEEFVASMRSDYEILRRNFITNVLTQVIERHLLRNFEEVVPDDYRLDDTQLESLVKLSGPMETRKAAIKERMEMINRSLQALNELD